MSINRKWILRMGSSLVVLALAISACAPSAAPTPTPTKPPAPIVAAPTQPPPKPTAALPTATPKPATVRFGSQSATSDVGVFIAVERGYFKELGLDVQLLEFQAGPAMIPPLASGDLEVAGGTISTGLLNAIERAMDLKIVATKGSARPGFQASWVTARKDLIDSGQVKEVKDLKGKKFGVASTKSGADCTISSLLKQGGLSLNDVELITMGYPDMIAAYANKAIDLAMQIEPTLNTAVERGLAVRWPLGGTSTIHGGEYQSAEMVYSGQFKNNTDAARRFMVGYVKGLRDYNDAFTKGKGKNEIISILTKYTSGKDPALYEKMGMPYQNPDGKLDVPSMKRDLNCFREMGAYTGKLEIESIVDNQFTDYAVQQLGAYK